MLIPTTTVNYNLRYNLPLKEMNFGFVERKKSYIIKDTYIMLITNLFNKQKQQKWFTTILCERLLEILGLNIIFSNLY